MSDVGPGFTRRSFLGSTAATALLAGLPASARARSAPGVGDGSALRLPGSLPDPTRLAGIADASLPFDHVIVVMMENHSFNNYLGMLPLRGQPKADGFRFNLAGVPTNSNPVDTGFQKAFHLPSTCQPGSVTQNWNSSHRQIDAGRMDGFAKTSSEAMGYWDESDLPFYYSLAKTFCLGNRCFASAPAQTYPNRRFLYSGTAQGTISTNSDGFKLPPPAGGTLMDLLSRHGISWRNYFTDLPAPVIIPQTLKDYPLHFSPVEQFYVDCLAGKLPAVSFVDPEFGLVDEVGSLLFKFLDKIPGLPDPIHAKLGVLRNKLNSFSGSEENPADITIGEAFVSRIVNAVMRSPAWSRTLLVWTYDEHGGYYDHVPPANVVAPDNIPPMLSATDIPGSYDITGMRVPTVVVSPYSRPNDVTNVVHDHTSIIATIARKWNLPALTYRDAQANTLLDFLDLQSPPAFLKPPRLAKPAVPEFGLRGCTGVAPEPVISPTA